MNCSAFSPRLSTFGNVSATRELAPIGRRQFLHGGAAALLTQVSWSSPSRRLRLLILGGTYYLGPAIVADALRQGHQITLFNRGKTNPNLFPDVEKLRGDRDVKSVNLDALRGARTWDAVIDVWPSDPDMVQATGRLLHGRVGRYVYVSSIAAYKNAARVGIVETDPLFDDAHDKAAWYEYGKAESERRLMALYGDAYSSVRPHSILGYRQDSDTFRFWSVRIARGGPVLAPGDGTDPVQFIDVCDVGRFTIAVTGRSLPGAFTLAGPTRGRLRFRDMLERLNNTQGGKAELTWIGTDFLIDQARLRPRVDLPMWVPLSRATRPGFMQFDVRKAMAAGLHCRSLEETATDEMRWFQETMPKDYAFGHTDRGITREREMDVLSRWNSESQRSA